MIVRSYRGVRAIALIVGAVALSLVGNKAQLPRGLKVGHRTFENHLDGYSFVPFLKGDVAEGPRRECFYFSEAVGNGGR